MFLESVKLGEIAHIEAPSIQDPEDQDSYGEEDPDPAPEEAAPEDPEL